MSIFDPILFDIIPTSCGTICKHHYYVDALFAKIERNNTELSVEEEDKLKRFYESTLSGEGLFHLIHLLASRDGVTVSLSDEEEVINIGFIETPINPYMKEDGRVVVLGKYNKEEDKIVLFVNTIRSVADEFKYKCTYSSGPSGTEIHEYRLKSCALLTYVLAHELYHAFFYKNIFMPKYEEPLAEFGALLYMNNYYHKWYDNKADEIMIGLHSFVQLKEKAGIKYYSQGARLFLNDNKKLIDKYKNCDVLQPQDLAEIDALIYG